MAYAKSESMQPTPLIKAAVQLDLLEVGKEYTASVALRAGKIRSRQFVVLGCYPDYYSIRDLTNGRVETLRKSDIHCGIIKIEGLNIKEKVLEVIEDLKVKEAERVKVAKDKWDMYIQEGLEWLLRNPGKGLDIVELGRSHNDELSYYLRGKLKEDIAQRGKDNGHNVIINVRNRQLLYRPEKVQIGNRNPGVFINRHLDGEEPLDEEYEIEESKPEPITATYKPEEMSATLESTNEILRVDGLKSVSAEMLGSIEGTMTLLRSVGKNVVLDIVFREV